MRLLNQDIQPPEPAPDCWATLVERSGRSIQGVCLGLFEDGPPDADTYAAAQQLCTASLLTQIWCDQRVEVMAHGRLYIPADIAAAHGLDLALMSKALSLDVERGCEGDARDGSCHCSNMPNTAMRLVLPSYRLVMRELVERSTAVLDEGRRGVKGLTGGPSRKLRRLELGSRARLRLLIRHRYDSLTRRLIPGRISQAWLTLRLKMGRF